MSALHELDVLIVGAGLSGIGCAYHLQDKCPGKSYTILESKESFGGTWHTHRYPGARSDSDLFTYGFNFRPWKGHPIAERSLILDYLKDTVDECGIRDNIRFNHCVRSASWDDATQRWTLTVHRTDTDEVETFVARYLWMCQGYYRHNQSYTPDWDGMETYKGDVVHPQFWPEDYDYSGKKVVVIGSGATAATVVPAMAKTAAHVTMLQRSPTYFFSEDNRNELAERLRALDVPEEWTHEIVRRDMLAFQKEVATRAFEEPQALRDELMEGVRAELGPDCSVDVDTHFNPRYMPWRQRLAFVPDGDLFAAIREERASVVTDEIDRFVENGILLKSGEVLEADLIVTATGFNLCILGDIDFEINGQPLDFSQTTTYMGMMYSGVPNLAWVFGYLRTSWTMRLDLIGDFFTKLINHMDETGAGVCTPTLRPEDQGMKETPFLDPEGFNPGYIMRGLHLLPKQGDKAPWFFKQDYYWEAEAIPAMDLEDGTLAYAPKVENQNEADGHRDQASAFVPTSAAAMRS